MQVQVTFKHMDSSEAMQELINQKLKHFTKFDEDKNSRIEWTCSTNHKIQSSDVRLHMNKELFHASAEDSDFNKTVDIVITKLESQLRSYNTRKTSRLKKARKGSHQELDA